MWGKGSCAQVDVNAQQSVSILTVTIADVDFVEERVAVELFVLDGDAVLVFVEDGDIVPVFEDDRVAELERVLEGVPVLVLLDVIDSVVDRVHDDDAVGVRVYDDDAVFDLVACAAAYVCVCGGGGWGGGYASHKLTNVADEASGPASTCFTFAPSRWA